MSLEQAIADNTAAIKQLIVVMSTVNESGAMATAEFAPGNTTAATTETGKRTRRTKAEIEAANAAAATGAAPAGNTYLLPGDPEGTRYFVIDAQRTVYKQTPGAPDCTVAGALIVSGAEYEQKRLAYLAQVAVANPNGAAVAQTTAAAPAPAPSTPAASTVSSTPSVASAVTIQTVTAKLMQVHKRDGNAGVAPILQKFGAATVPALANCDLVAVDAAVEAVLNPVASANLFG